jgi:hypothetical protein
LVTGVFRLSLSDLICFDCGIGKIYFPQLGVD